MSVCAGVCVLTNFTVHSHAQLNSAAAQFWAEETLISPLMEEGGGRRGRELVVAASAVGQNGNLQVHSA